MWCSVEYIRNQAGDPFEAASITAWGDPAARRSVHRRHVRNLSALTVAIALGAAVLHPTIAMLAVVIVPLLALEVSMLRRARVVAPTNGSPCSTQPPSKEP